MDAPPTAQVRPELPPPGPVVARSARELRRQIDHGDLSCAEVVGAFLDRVDDVNPLTNAIVSRRDRDEVIDEAHAADDVLLPDRGPLHGLPVAVKDLADVAGVPTTFGSPLFVHHIPQHDGLVARRLRRAGAIIIGKTNTPEMGLGSHTFNPIFGTTHNPYDLTRSAGGSSGGAAASLAADMLPIADGSDMMGSLRNPAAWCNVYGMRPTWGLVPNAGPGDGFIATMATEGPMARNLGDLALLLDVLAGPHPGSPFPVPASDYSAAARRPVEQPVRIGWLGDWGGAYPCEPGILDLCRTRLADFEAAGHHVETIDPPMGAERLWHAWVTLRSATIANSQRSLYADPAKRALMKPELVWEIEAGLTVTTEQLFAASTVRTQWYARAAEMFSHVDAVVMPSAQFWPIPSDYRYPDAVGGLPADTYHRWMEIVVPVSLIGLPSLAMPAGFDDRGLPMGLQLIGPAGADAALLSIAATVVGADTLN